MGRPVPAEVAGGRGCPGGATFWSPCLHRLYTSWTQAPGFSFCAALVAIVFRLEAGGFSLCAALVAVVSGPLPACWRTLDSSAPAGRPLRSLSQSPADRSRVPQCTRWCFRSAPGDGDSGHRVLIFDPFRYELHRWGSFHHGKDVLVVRDDDFENLSRLEHTYTGSA